MTGDDEADLQVPEGLRADGAVVDAPVGRAEQIGAATEWIGQQRGQAWPAKTRRLT
jgi:hypothetical protein